MTEPLLLMVLVIAGGLMVDRVIGWVLSRLRSQAAQHVQQSGTALPRPGADPTLLREAVTALQSIQQAVHRVAIAVEQQGLNGLSAGHSQILPIGQRLIVEITGLDGFSQLQLIERLLSEDPVLHMPTFESYRQGRAEFAVIPRQALPVDRLQALLTQGLGMTVVVTSPNDLQRGRLCFRLQSAFNRERVVAAPRGRWDNRNGRSVEERRPGGV